MSFASPGTSTMRCRASELSNGIEIIGQFDNRIP
jgi:hypothetical protein